MKKQTQFKQMRGWGFLLIGSLVGLLTTTPSDKVEGAGLGGPTHIGTFEGSTTFTTSSSNGVNPGLFIEVMDEYGNLTQYKSEDGIITVPNTKEGAYVTQAKLLGKTKYRDQDTGELLDQWEEGRNLALESVQMPVLTTTGENVFSQEITDNGVLYYDSGVVGYHDKSYWTTDFIEIEPNKNYSFMMGGDSRYCLYDENKTYITGGTSRSFNTSEARYVKISGKSQNLMLVYGTEVPEIYKPFKSNILSTPSDLELRGIDDVKDTLDCLTGKVTQRISEIVLNGSEETWGSSYETTNAMTFKLPLRDCIYKGQWTNNTLKNDYGFKQVGWFYIYNDKLDEECYAVGDNKYLHIRVLKSRLNSVDVNGFKSFLSANPITIQYVLATESIKTVVLDSTYYFQPVMNREVYVDGNILPLVCSVTIPTETLSFVINPNEEDGKEFIAPEFTITNHNRIPIYLELKSFTQTTDVLNDVLPNQYENWEELNQTQSKDIALALVPKPSEGWKTLVEGERYVADASNYYLGEIKAKSSVDFTFTASHGFAFIEAIQPQYRLSFIFDFFER